MCIVVKLYVDDVADGTYCCVALIVILHVYVSTVCLDCVYLTICVHERDDISAWD